ncbi:MULTISPECIES: AMP-binding protein [unclassified Saccharibacter]|uniref:AMP-binding protein n=1 Tax=unclassified Saccharibacter TaxID=2648722 RepID=UPI001321E7A9|nr:MULTISPECIES: AMP-binding protein [unclassified Saccharibacter]MXV36879.1 AMP-binding protein [Saccharibacter sp. EH611]MXV58631.1 AMP-binding protein [Saccharibacter sp. EH70]MXV66137.1 AMP-binding protein [Saccharibacter sp. EH60]
MAERLPDQPLVNLHANLLDFTVVFLATILRGQSCFLSSQQAPSQLLALQRDHNAVCSDPNLPDGPQAVTLPPLSELNAQRWDNPVIPAETIVAEVFTSGSTGHAKKHRKCWGELVARSHTALPLLAVTPHHTLQRTTLLGTVPPYHMYGFETLILQSLHTQTITASGPCFFPSDIEKLLAHTPAPHTLVTTPVHLRSLTAARATLPSLDRIISASAPLPADLARQAEEDFNAPVMEIYGSTETGSIASRRTLSNAPWRLYDGTTLSLDPTDKQHETFLFKAPYATPHPLNDVIALNDDQHFHLIGRKGDILKIAGKRTSYAALNKALVQIEGVLDGCFAPLLTEGETAGSFHEPTRLQAFVVAPSRDTHAIMKALRQHIDPPFIPRRLIPLSALPRNSVGKLTRQTWEALVKRYMEKRCYGTFSIPATHPALPGHFPDNPIVPGVVLLDAVFHRLQCDVSMVTSVKFLSLVRPDQPMTLYANAIGENTYRFTLHHADGRAEGGTIVQGRVKGLPQ